MATEKEVLEEVAKLLKESPALNGGFAKLEQDIADIKTSQAEIREAQIMARAQQEKLQQDIKHFYKEKAQIYNDLYGPDKGVYQRINDIEDKQDSLNAVVGDNNEKLIEVFNTKKRMNRMFWALIAGLVSLGSKFLYDVTQFFS